MLRLFIYIFIYWCIYEIIFFCTHLTPLNGEEIQTLAEKRRIIEVNNYFVFSEAETTVNLKFKSGLDASGRMYVISKKLQKLPSYVAALLKSKKHEWIVVAVEKDQLVEYMWVNKGPNKSSVALFIPFEELIRRANSISANTLLVFHNHPNPNPNRYDCTNPSQIDLDTAKKWEEQLGNNNLNLIEFVCERGLSYRYHSYISDKFMPVIDFRKKLEIENGISKRRNYHLHKELRKLKNLKAKL
jgi:hypothetical protein